jgi:hypothetical protein
MRSHLSLRSYIFTIAILCLIGLNPNAYANETASLSPSFTLSGGGNYIDSSVSINGPIYIVANTFVASVNYPNLEFVNGPIYIVDNQNLAAVNFPKLKFVNGPIYVTYNSSLQVANFAHSMFVNGPVYYYMNAK